MDAMLSRFSRVRLCVTPKTQPTKLCCPWDSPGKNTGVGCHFLLQCMKEKSESEVAQACPTVSDPMDCSLPGSSVHGFSRQEYWSGVPLPSPTVRIVPLFPQATGNWYKNFLQEAQSPDNNMACVTLLLLWQLSFLSLVYSWLCILIF